MTKKTVALVALMILGRLPVFAQDAARPPAQIAVDKNAAPSTKSLTVNDILAMVRAKQSTTAIIAKIQTSVGSFGQISERELRAKGVLQVVINEMIENSEIFYVAEQASSIPHALGELTNTDVLTMFDTGLSPDVIVAKINASKCSFDTDPPTLAELKVERVPESVILAMVKAPVIADQPPQSTTDASATPTSTSLTDYQYLGKFPACADLIKTYDDFSSATRGASDLSVEANRVKDINWFLENSKVFGDAQSRCANDSDVKADSRAPDAAVSMQASVLSASMDAGVIEAGQRYNLLVAKYNSLVNQYNDNLAYVRSMAYRLSIAQYFTNMFQRPQPRTLNCSTSEDNGFGTTMSCTGN